MDLLLHSPTTERELSRHYELAFKNAVELFAVTAYLTNWDDSLELNPECRSFRMIVGINFRITRKAACEKVMRWLPPKRKAQFMVADRISGFHPKALFWKEKNGRCFAIVGSSNLTQAAFETNYEANVFSPLSETDYVKAKKWVKQIEKQSVVVSEDWLKKYREALLHPHGAHGITEGLDATRVVPLNLPMPTGINEAIAERRDQLAAYGKKRTGLMRLFRRCASGEITSKEFYDQLPTFWSEARLQGRGWERQGKDSDFQAVSRSFVRILGTAVEDRDDVVTEELDRLASQHIAARGAFMSEMLCLRFPAEYPVLNKPIRNYLKEIAFKVPRAASEGASFIHLAQTLRSSLLDTPAYPAKNLAELDCVIWLAYGKKS